MKENCFKLVGYPNWYVDLQKNRKDKKGTKQKANMTESKANQDLPIQKTQHDWMADMIKQEVAKALKAAKITNEGSSNVNFIHTLDYAGMKILR